MKKIFIRSLVSVLVLSMLLGSLASMNVFALEVDDTPVEVGVETALLSGETAWLSLTPEENGYYYIYSMGMTDTVCTLYDCNFTMIDYCDDYSEYDLNFFIEGELTAGQKYYLMIDTISEAEEEFYVMVEKLPSAEELYIEAEDFSSHLGETQYFYASLYPYDCAPEEVYWEIDDPDIAYVSGYEDYCNVVFIKAGTTTLRAYTESGLSASVEIEGVENPEILLNEEVTVSYYENGGNAYFSFIPPADGVYTFYSKGSGDIDGYIYTEDLSTVGYNYEGGENMNFRVTSELFAGEKYILESYCYDYPDSDEEEYTVGIINAFDAKDVVIECLVGQSGYIGDVIAFSALFLPECSTAEDCIWTVADESVAEVFYENTECEVTFVGEGKTTLTVTTASGLTDSVEIECLHIPVIDLDETVTVSLKTGDYDIRKFVPNEDGTYVFYSEGESYVDGNLFDSEMNFLASSVSGGNNYTVKYYLFAGEEYYISSTAFSEDENAWNTFDITVTRATQAEGIMIDDVDMNEDTLDKLYVGDMMFYMAKFIPATAEEEACTWTVDSEGVIEIMDLTDYGMPNFCAVSAIAEGTATLTVTTESGYTASLEITVYEGELVLGDVDGDGDVGGKDSNILKQYLAGATNNINELNADINMDSSIDAKDSNLLKQYIAGVFDFGM